MTEADSLTEVNSEGSDQPPSNPTDSSPAPADESAPSVDPSRTPPYTHTRASGYWAAVVVGLLVLLILVIFILENGQIAKVSFFGAHGHLPQGVALLLSAIIGGLFVVLAGGARILQLRSRANQDLKKAPRTPKRHRRAVLESTSTKSPKN